MTILIGLFALLVVGAAWALLSRRPYEYSAWTVNRKTGECNYIWVKMWFFAETDTTNPPERIDLAPYGALTAPDVTHIALRNVRRWYPWSENDDNANDEDFEPGHSLWWGRHHLFEFIRGPAMLGFYGRERIAQMTTERLDIWNSSLLETDPKGVQEAVTQENWRLFGDIPKP